MKRMLWVIILGLIAGFAQVGAAQHVQLSEAEMNASGESYAEAIRFRGIDNDVAYFDPSQPPPPLETQAALQSEREEQDRGTDVGATFELGEVSMFVIASIILFAIAYLFVAFGGRLPVSFARNPENGEGQDRGRILNTRKATAVPLAIEAVLRMADRRIALVALCKNLLVRVVSAEGILLQDSWTDRDALRRVPRDFAQRDALQSLVFASERVQFGGRDVTEDEFRDYVTKLKPLWTTSS